MKKASEVARYHFQPGPSYKYYMAVQKDGSWVRYSDHVAALTADREAVREEVRADRDRLAGEVEKMETYAKEKLEVIERERERADALAERVDDKEGLVAENKRLRAALEEVVAWDLQWADGLDVNVERIQTLARKALEET